MEITLIKSKFSKKFHELLQYCYSQPSILSFWREMQLATSTAAVPSCCTDAFQPVCCYYDRRSCAGGQQPSLHSGTADRDQPTLCYKGDERSTYPALVGSQSPIERKKFFLLFFLRAKKQILLHLCKIFQKKFLEKKK